jgi:hypothetical protein
MKFHEAQAQVRLQRSTCAIQTNKQLEIPNPSVQTSRSSDYFSDFVFHFLFEILEQPLAHFGILRFFACNSHSCEWNQELQIIMSTIDG